MRTCSSSGLIFALIRAINSTRSKGHSSYSPKRLDDAVQRLEHASAPLIGVLDPETLQAVRGEQAG